MVAVVVKLDPGAKFVGIDTALIVQAGVGDVACASARGAPASHRPNTSASSASVRGLLKVAVVGVYVLMLVSLLIVATYALTVREKVAVEELPFAGLYLTCTVIFSLRLCLFVSARCSLGVRLIVSL